MSHEEEIAEELKKLDIELEILTIYNPETVTLVKDEETDEIRITIDEDKSILHLKARKAFPITSPTKFIQLYGTKPDGTLGKMFGVLSDTDTLSNDNRKLLNEVLKQTSTVPLITKVTLITDHFHAYEIEVQTDQGDKKFYIGRPREHIQRRGSGKYVITDLNKSRYEISDLQKLDSKSKILLDRIL